MRPLSPDLRKRILAALETEPSSLIVGEKLGVSASSVRKLWRKVARTGDATAGKAPGRERLVKGVTEDRLLEIVAQSPDATLNVLRELLDDDSGVAVSETTMWRQLGRMGLSRKKSRSAPRKRIART